MIRQALTCVDFLPTVIKLMGFETAGQEEGRDAARLFLGESTADWKDVAFMRGAGRRPNNWLAAISSRYKLVYSPRDEPWLFDLEKDPNEQINFFRDPAYRETVRNLSRELIAYGRTYRDPYVDVPRIRAGLARAAGSTGVDAQPGAPEARSAAKQETRRQR